MNGRFPNFQHLNPVYELSTERRRIVSYVVLHTATRHREPRSILLGRGAFTNKNIQLLPSFRCDWKCCHLCSENCEIRHSICESQIAMGKSSSDVSSEEDLCKSSAIGAWLHFLQMDQYYQEFIDNGYDDLETAKKIGAEDLDAIGVEDQHHKIFLLDAVRVLREQGAAWVYLLESTQTLTDSGLGDPGDRASAGSSGIASLPWTDHDASSSGDNSTCSSSKIRNNKLSKTKCLVEVTPEHSARNISVHSSPRIHSGNNIGMRKLLLPEEEDLIQRVSELHTGNIKSSADVIGTAGIFLKSGHSNASKRNCDQDFLQLCNLVKDRLNREGISLASPPFTTKVRHNL